MNKEKKLLKEEEEIIEKETRDIIKINKLLGEE